MWSQAATYGITGWAAAHADCSVKSDGGRRDLGSRRNGGGASRPDFAVDFADVVAGGVEAFIEEGF